jgi:hypothetical protein
VVTEKETDITITPKTLGIGLAVLVAFAGAVGSIPNQLYSGARADPFTGTQGRALTARIDTIDAWIREHDRFARDRSIVQAEQDAKQDAQIQEIYRRLPH